MWGEEVSPRAFTGDLDLRDAFTKPHLVPWVQFLLLGPEHRVSNQDVNSCLMGWGRGQCIYCVCGGEKAARGFNFEAQRNNMQCRK